MPADGSKGQYSAWAPRRLKREDQGFTLMELLVVLAVLGLLLAGVFGFFLFGARVYHEGTDQAQAQHQLRYAAEYITREVRFANNFRMFPQAPEEALGDFNYIFLGGESDHALIHLNSQGSRVIADACLEALSFTIIQPGGSGGGSTFKYKLVLEMSAAEGDRLYTMQSAILLPNCADYADGPEAFPVIRYLKPK